MRFKGDFSNETDDDNSLVNGGYDTDKEVSESRDQPNQDARSHRSNSTIDVDSNFMDTPQNENQNEGNFTELICLIIIL